MQIYKGNSCRINCAWNFFTPLTSAKEWVGLTRDARRDVLLRGLEISGFSISSFCRNSGGRRISMGRDRRLLTSYKEEEHKGLVPIASWALKRQLLETYSNAICLNGLRVLSTRSTCSSQQPLVALHSNLLEQIPSTAGRNEHNQKTLQHCVCYGYLN